MEMFKINGEVSMSKIDTLMLQSFQIVQDYVNGIMNTYANNRIFGIYDKKDIVGDLRRAIMFLVFLYKERLNDESYGVYETNTYYIDKYETESYRDYLVCRGVDKDIVDALFDLYQLYHVQLDHEEVSEDLDVGIGRMIIEGSTTPFKIN